MGDPRYLKQELGCRINGTAQLTLTPALQVGNVITNGLWDAFPVASCRRLSLAGTVSHNDSDMTNIDATIESDYAKEGSF